MGESSLLKSELMNEDICVRLCKVKKKKNLQSINISDLCLIKGIKFVDYLKGWKTKNVMVVAERVDKRKSNIIWPGLTCTFQLELTTPTDHFTGNTDFSYLNHWIIVCFFFLFSCHYSHLLHQLPVSISPTGVTVKTSFLSDFWSLHRISNP